MSARTAPPTAGGRALRRTLRDGTNRQRLDLLLSRDELRDADHAELLAAGPRFAAVLRVSWRHPDPAVRRAAAAFAADAGLLTAGAGVLGLLADGREEVKAAAAAALVGLADAADATVRAGEADDEGRRAFVAALAAHLTAGGPRSAAVAGWLAASSAAGDGELVASLAHPAAGPLLAAVLRDDRHPGVFRVLLGLLSLRKPPRAAVVAAERTDPGFLVPLLRSVARAGAGSLPGLPPLPWLAEPGPILAALPAALQPAVAAVAGRSREPGASRRAVRTWLIARGSADGRRAAEPVLRELPADRRWAVLTDAAANADAAVVAWAAGLLGPHRVPHWPRRLADLTAHPSEPVRAAATAALRDAAANAG